MKPYLTRQEALELQTEKEWKENAQRVRSMDYDIQEDWSERATEPGTKDYLHRMGVSAYHREEGYDI